MGRERSMPEGDIRIIATGLGFPEGPVWMADGSVILGEISGKKVTRVAPDGTKTEIGKAGGGPNGVATGPDGALYVCNNGGAVYETTPSFLSTGPAPDYKNGSIQRIDLKTGETKTLYTECNGHKLSAPNDIVFDRQGGFYFTDLGKRYAHHRDNGGLYYALPDGSKIVELAYPLLTPNGVGLSPDEKTVYVADTESSRLFAFDIVAPGSRQERAFPGAVWRALRLRAARLPALRQPRGRGLRQYLRRDADHRPHHGDFAVRPGRARRSRCRTSTRPISASAAPTCAPPTSRCRPRASSPRCSGRNRA